MLLATSHRENMILLNEERIEFEDFIKLLSPNSSRLTKTNKSTNPIVKNYSQKNQNNIISEKKSKSNPYNKIEINKNGDKFVYANYLFALDKAIEFGEIELILSLIKCIEPPTVSRETALKRAVQVGNLKVVRFFVEQGIYDLNKLELLPLATKYNHMDIVKYLIKKGARIYINNNSTDTKQNRNTQKKYVNDTLDYYIYNGDLEMVRYLNNHGVDIHKDRDRSLYQAARFGHLHIVKYLVENGAKNPNALRAAAINDHLDIVEYLLNNGADIQIFKNRAFCDAASYGYLDIVSFLLENGADINSENDLALRGATNWGKTDTVEYLLEHGANIHAENDEALRTAVKYRKTDTMKCLLEHGADIHADNDAALKMAAGWGNIYIVKYLVEHGADIHADNDAALKEAIKQRKERVIKYFQSLEEDEISDKEENVVDSLENDTMNSMLLFDAIEKNNTEIVKFLIENGISLDEKNDIAIWKAIQKQNLDIVNLLIQNSGKYKYANTEIYDSNLDENVKKMHFLAENETTIYEMANNLFIQAGINGYTEVVKYFVECGADVSVQDNIIFKSYIERKDSVMLDYLAENGAVVTESANIILDLALENGDVSMINVVEDYSPESIIDYTIDFDKSTPDNQVAYNYLRNLKARLVVTLT